MRENAKDLAVDWAACQGHGLCSELLPDHIVLDDWGYPVISGPVSADAAKRARRAVIDCPTLALKLKARAAESAR
jgi:ferredoxin